MKEYFGASAAMYDLTERKRFVLLPAVQRYIKKASSQKRLLDLACGNGAFYTIATNKGYRYFGLDISEDMIKLARAKYPKGSYLVANANNFSHLYKQKFDIILSMLLLPSLKNYRDIIATLKECRKSLKPGGRLILGIAHPAFDQYMQVGLFGRQGIKTKFKGYFTQGTKFEFTKQFHNGNFTFEDYHYTVSDYINALSNAGLTLLNMDECPPNKKLQETNPSLHEKYSQFPGYLILMCGLH